MADNPIQAGKFIEEFESLIFTDPQKKPAPNSGNDSQTEKEVPPSAKSAFVSTDPQAQKLTETPRRSVQKIFRS